MIKELKLVIGDKEIEEKVIKEIGDRIEFDAQLKTIHIIRQVQQLYLEDYVF